MQLSWEHHLQTYLGDHYILQVETLTKIHEPGYLKKRWKLVNITNDLIISQ